MNRFLKIISLSCLIFVIVFQAVFAEPDETLKGIFDALLSEDSAYSENKALYAEYYPETKFVETLNDGSFTITISGNEYIDGSWTFVQDGNYLTLTTEAGDLYGSLLTAMVVNAVGKYYDMDTDILNGYINGLSMLEIENDNFTITPEENGEAVTVRINIAGPYDMKELDEMVLDEKSLFFEPLGEDYLSNAASIGRIMMIANGNAEELTILLGENGGLDDLAYQSLINTVMVLQPKGWESFIAEYSGLADAQTPLYTVTLNVDEAAVKEIIDDPREGDSFAIIRFGAQ